MEKAVLSTIAYYDIFDYPLTSWEIWKFLYCREYARMSSVTNIREYDFVNAQKILNKSKKLKDVLDFSNGFYFLKGRERIVEERRKKYLLAQKRWKKLQKIVSVLQVAPFVKMIAGCNNLLINNLKPDSDIDVFIIVKSGRMWMARFFITFLVSLMRQWRHKGNIAGRICLSFFVTDDNLNLEYVAKKPYDIYLNNWIFLVAPLLDQGVYKRFIKENLWARKSLNNALTFLPVGYERKIRKNVVLEGFRKFGEKVLGGRFGDLIETGFKKMQVGKMRGRGTDVIVSDKMLKFHEVDRRDEFRCLFGERIEKILNIEY